MSSDSVSSSVATPVSYPCLTALEQRVLGVLVEKAKTTPDIYPLSLNALLTGCNQKSNRDPVTNLTDVQVEEGLMTAQKKGLVIKITGGRVERWRHTLYETWRVEKVELAILAELLLRGPQTEGELRARASRMEPIADLDVLRAVLKSLAERRLVIYLTPEGRRGTMLTHGFHASEELERLRSKHGKDAEPATFPEAGVPPMSPARSTTDELSLERRFNEVGAEIERLRSVVLGLEAKVASLAEQVRDIRQDRDPSSRR